METALAERAFYDRKQPLEDIAAGLRVLKCQRVLLILISANKEHAKAMLRRRHSRSPVTSSCHFGLHYADI